MIISTIQGFKIDLKNETLVEGTSCTVCGEIHKSTTVHDEMIVECAECGINAMKCGKEILVGILHFNFWANNAPVISNITVKEGKELYDASK